jgi:hypothetical protein
MLWCFPWPFWLKPKFAKESSIAKFFPKMVVPPADALHQMED